MDFSGIGELAIWPRQGSCPGPSRILWLDDPCGHYGPAPGRGMADGGRTGENHFAVSCWDDGYHYCEATQAIGLGDSNSPSLCRLRIEPGLLPIWLESGPGSR